MILGASVLCLQQVIFVYNFFFVIASCLFCVIRHIYIIAILPLQKFVYVNSRPIFAQPIFVSQCILMRFFFQFYFWVKMISNCLVKTIFCIHVCGLPSGSKLKSLFQSVSQFNACMPIKLCSQTFVYTHYEAFHFIFKLFIKGANFGIFNR